VAGIREIRNAYKILVGKSEKKRPLSHTGWSVWLPCNCRTVLLLTLPTAVYSWMASVTVSRVFTEHHNPALYSGGSWVQISAQRPATLTEVFCGFFSPSRWLPESYLKLGHNRFLPNPFQFIIHLSTIIWCYIILVTENTSSIRLQINK
jgi:hypothetical protein